ncbi:MAG: SurA N-terminal domain-containing protein [Chthoniobacterales bacterium]|nr:SurA N-terminal domain-containing protein [Chthoniobacterales bacterium]
MITMMRKHHKVLMIFITALVCISFSWYWNKTDFSQMGSGVVGKIYDHNVSQVEYQRNARLLRLGSDLGMRELVQALTYGAQTENEAYASFSWNLMVLRHEADALGIQPTTTEIADLVKTLPAFQGENGFDVAKYTDFADHALSPMGFSEAQVEELAADQIALGRVEKILGAGVSVPDEEMRTNFTQLYSKMEVSTVHLHNADFEKEVQTSDADIAKYFEAHKAQLQTDEKRKISFANFGLTEEQKKLTGKPRIDVLQKLADSANDFTEALQAKDADFAAVAQKFKLTPKETGEFSRATPDPLFAATPALTQSAFSLTKAAPNGDAIQTPDGFYIEHLLQVDPARPLTLEEARPRIVEALKTERLQTLLAAKAQAVSKQIRDALQSGKTVEEAATQAGVKAEKIPAFALLDNPPGASPAPTPDPKTQTPEMETIKQAVGEMNPGAVSEMIPQADGGMLVVMEKREPLNAAQYEAARPLLETRVLRGKSQIVFFEWLRDRRRSAGVQETQPQRAPG